MQKPILEQKKNKKKEGGMNMEVNKKEQLEMLDRKASNTRIILVVNGMGILFLLSIVVIDLMNRIR
jgi:hypothetical protein